MRRFALGVVPVIVAGFVFSGHAAATGTTYYVSTTGSDTNPCTQAAPCATIQYAVNLASAGDTVKVEAGTYYQTVNITKPVHLEGAGKAKTTIDGHGIDTAAMGYYGVVSVQNNTGPGGAISISGLTIEHSYITAQEYNEIIVPTDVSIYGDQNASDTISVSNVYLGPVDDPADYGGIGFYTFNDVANVTFSSSTSTGNFQGALLEGGGFGGKVNVHGVTFTGLVNCSGTCSGGGTYPAEGLFLLSDQPGTAVATVSNNIFKGYAGFGIAANAGYSGGNCTPPNGPCTGNANLTANNNMFALGPCSTSDQPPACAAIDLDSQSGNQLTAYLKDNGGYVTSPDKKIVEENGGGLYSVTEIDNHITVKS